MAYQPKQCFFCSQNIELIDYKDVALLKRFISGQAKIIDPKYSGTCSRHQRRVSTAVKRSRFLGLLPFVRR
jgi:small subunit ribosomal protein S18